MPDSSFVDLQNMGKCKQFNTWNFPASKYLVSHSKLGCHSRVDCAGCSIKIRRPKAMPRAAINMVLAANRLPQATDGYPAFPFGNSRLLWWVPWFLSNKFTESVVFFREQILKQGKPNRWGGHGLQNEQHGKASMSKPPSLTLRTSLIASLSTSNPHDTWPKNQ